MAVRRLKLSILATWQRHESITTIQSKVTTDGFPKNSMYRMYRMYRMCREALRRQEPLNSARPEAQRVPGSIITRNPTWWH